MESFSSWQFTEFSIIWRLSVNYADSIIYSEVSSFISNKYHNKNPLCCVENIHMGILY